MRADYDSQADALSIDLVPVTFYDEGDQVDDDYCNVGIVGGKVVSVELLYPTEHLDLLEVAAERYNLDRVALLATAQAALAAPDRLVSVDLSGSLVA